MSPDRAVTSGPPPFLSHGRNAHEPRSRSRGNRGAERGSGVRSLAPEPRPAGPVPPRRRLVLLGLPPVQRPGRGRGPQLVAHPGGPADLRLLRLAPPGPARRRPRPRLLVGAGRRLRGAAELRLVDLPRPERHVPRAVDDPVPLRLRLVRPGHRRMRLLWFPVAYLVLAVKIPDSIWQQIAFQLQQIASAGSEITLTIAGALLDFRLQADGQDFVMTWLSGGVYEEARFSIAEACSGLRMLMAFVALGVALAFLSGSLLVAAAGDDLHDGADRPRGEHRAGDHARGSEPLGPGARPRRRPHRRGDADAAARGGALPAAGLGAGPHRGGGRGGGGGGREAPRRPGSRGPRRRGRGPSGSACCCWAGRRSRFWAGSPT